MIAERQLQQGERLERLYTDVRAAARPEGRAQIDELLRLVTEPYGAAVRSLAAVLHDVDPAALDRVLLDPAVSGIVALQGVHPTPLARRIEEALDVVRPVLAHHSGDVELVAVDEAAAAVLLRLIGSCDGCPSSTVTVRQTIEAAIVERAPEIAVIDVVEASESMSPGAVPVTLGPRRRYDRCPDLAESAVGS